MGRDEESGRVWRVVEERWVKKWKKMVMRGDGVEKGEGRGRAEVCRRESWSWTKVVVEERGVAEERRELRMMVVAERRRGCGRERRKWK